MQMIGQVECKWVGKSVQLPIADIIGSRYWLLEKLAVAMHAT